MSCIINTISELPSHPDPVIMDPDLNQAHEIFEGLAARYGKMFVVQFAGQPMVVVADAKPLNFILCKRPELFGPYRRNSRILQAIRSDGIETADDNDWRLQRELIATSMESSCLAQYFETVRGVTEALRQRWLGYGELLSESDFEAEIFGFSASMFTTIMFGDMSYLPPDERETAGSLLLNLAAVLGGRIDELLPQMHLESYSGNKDFEVEIEKIVGTVENLIEYNKSLSDRNNGGGTTKNLLQVLIGIMDAKGLSARQVKLTENVLQILLASEPTTSDTLFRVLRYLAENPEVQTEIRNEVDAISGKRCVIEDIKDIKKLKCVDAAIMETMRIASVSRLVLVQAKTDLLLEELEIAGGTPLVLLTAYCGLEEENFHRAGVFDYQRWHRDSRADDEPHNGKAALGFGVGPRSCPGRGLAMLVMKTAVAMICGNFQIRLKGGKAAPDDLISESRPQSLGFRLELRD
jgi:cytochrome P450